MIKNKIEIKNLKLYFYKYIQLLKEARLLNIQNGIKTRKKRSS